MEIVYHALVVLHFIGLAALLGGFLGQMASPTKNIPTGMFHGALTQLITGIALVGMRESGVIDGDPINHMKIGIKTLIVIVITILVVLNRKKETVPTGIWGAIGGLSIANIAIAVFWE